MFGIKRLLHIIMGIALAVQMAYAQHTSDAQDQVKEYLRYYQLEKKATPQEVEKLTALRLKLLAPTSTQAEREAVYVELFPLLYHWLGTTPAPPEQLYKPVAQNLGQQAHQLLTSGAYQPVGNATTPPGQFGAVEKQGRGAIPMILLADANTDWTLYKSFMERNASRYTMYAVTLPGCGDSPLPPAPSVYVPGATPLWDNVVQGLVKLIAQHKLDRPVIVGTQASGYAAARMALAYPDKTRAIVLLDTLTNIPYRSLANPDVPATRAERLQILATRPTTMGILADFGPRVRLERAAIEQLLQNTPTPQRQFLLYSNLRDKERGQALFINARLKSDPWVAHYNLELNGTDLGEDLQPLKNAATLHHCLA
ncbi:MAG: alpha/beta fold hydrolase [Blastocatellia bacterium]